MKTLLVCVGTGGIFYHGLSRMATFCHRRGDTEVVLIDPDKVEEKNAARQWGTGIGQPKVRVAGMALFALGIKDVIGLPHIASMETAKRWVDVVKEYCGRDKGFDNKPKEVVGRIIVISTPDNHLCRVNVHEGCRELASITHPGVEVIEITAGNSLERGYAYGCVHHRQNSMSQKNVGRVITVCEGDWNVRHPDIAREAEKERQELAHPQPCGGLESPVGEVEQSMTSNQLTALCVWDLAEMMVVEGMVGEVQWVNIVEQTELNKKGKWEIPLSKRYTKVWANLEKRGK